ncbi:MAG: hypothetical protein KDK64_03945 [Chlamydiia bacterium]|nr:hypothetical protein [Chlamydiia bacterium]
MKQWILLVLFLPHILFSEEKTLPLVLSVPKAGGHLVLKMLSLFPEPPECVWADHIVSHDMEELSLEDAKVSKVIIIRDLRDVFVSLVYWFDAQVAEGLVNRHLAAKRKGLRERIQHWRSCSFDEKLQIVLEDGAESFYYEGFMRENIEQACHLLKGEKTQVMRFEDLIGVQGGGSQEAQEECIRRFAEVFSQSLSEEEVKRVSDKTFGKTHASAFDRTFRKGQIGSWKEHYNEKNLLLFYMRYGRYQKLLGY